MRLITLQCWQYVTDVLLQPQIKYVKINIQIKYIKINILNKILISVYVLSIITHIHIYHRLEKN